MDLSESGAEAAASIAITIGDAAAPAADVAIRSVPFIADHPFLYLIRDVKTGDILFIGRMEDPSAAHDCAAGSGLAGDVEAGAPSLGAAADTDAADPVLLARRGRPATRRRSAVGDDDDRRLLTEVADQAARGQFAGLAERGVAELLKGKQAPSGRRNRAYGPRDPLFRGLYSLLLALLTVLCRPLRVVAGSDSGYSASHFVASGACPRLPVRVWLPVYGPVVDSTTKSFLGLPRLDHSKLQRRSYKHHWYWTYHGCFPSFGCAAENHAAQDRRTRLSFLPNEVRSPWDGLRQTPATALTGSSKSMWKWEELLASPHCVWSIGPGVVRGFGWTSPVPGKMGAHCALRSHIWPGW